MTFRAYVLNFFISSPRIENLYSHFTRQNKSDSVTIKTKNNNKLTDFLTINNTIIYTSGSDNKAAAGYTVPNTAAR